MKKFPKLSRQARLYKQGQADTHKNRRHYHKLMVAYGYEPYIIRIEQGRIYRGYTYTVPIPLQESTLSGFSV